MKAILKIGYEEYLMPADDAMKVLKLMTSAIRCRDRGYQGTDIELTGDEMKLNVSIVSPKAKYFDKDNEPIVPAQASKKGTVKALPAPRLLKLTNGKTL